MKKLSKNELGVSPNPKRRCIRNGELAKYLGISKMYVWRLKNDPGHKNYNFPKASKINGIEFNDVDKIDAWMEAREGVEACPP